MKFLKFCLIFCLLISIFSTSASAYEKNERINWFFKTKSENTPPEILGGSDLPKKYGAIYLGDQSEKTIYLTFDAGYSNENVDSILDTLKKHQIQGAFFILPGIIKNSPETVKRMADEGHLICNHSTTHGDMSRITDVNKFKKELNGVEELYRQTFGLEMEKFFRPPQGSFSVNTLEFCKELGYTPVFWSFAYVDWEDDKQPDTEKAKNKILSCAHNGMVMLLHPTSKTNALVFDEVITELKSRGYNFGSLNELAEKQSQ